jgi:hypothetical protein
MKAYLVIEGEYCKIAEARIKAWKEESTITRGKITELELEF